MSNANLKNDNNKKASITGKIDELLEKIKSYQSFLNVEIEDNSEEIKRNYHNIIDSMKKSVEQLKGKQLTPSKKLEQMNIKLDISELNAALRLKEIELEDELENAKDEFENKKIQHSANVDKRKNEIIDLAKSSSETIEKVIKSRDNELTDEKNEKIVNLVTTLDNAWKIVRERYADMIESERKNIKIFSLRLEDLSSQKTSIANFIEKSQKEKEFLEGKIQLEIIDGESSDLMENENQQIDDSQKKINKIEREIKKISIQRDTSKEKIDIIKTMIDEIIEEMLFGKFKEAEVAIPDFIASIKYFGTN